MKKSIMAVAVVLLAGVLFLVDKVNVSRRNNEIEILRCVADSLAGEIKRVGDMSVAMQVLYGITEPEGAMLASEFRRAESDSIGWETFAAVCRVESGFDPTLTSGAGCKGLMQLSDSTAAATARAAGIKWRKVAPWADALNVRVGCIYLGGLAAKFGEGTAVKMYLAGEPRIRRRAEMATQQAEEYMARVMVERERLRYVYAGVRAGKERR